MGQRTKAFLVLQGLMAVFLLVHYGPVLRAPNAVLFAGDADGLKNYYTFLYHIRNDSDAFQFRGMEHPFGSQVLYTDGHWLLAEPLRWLRSVVPGVADHAVGVLNLLMVLGLSACAAILFFLLTDLGCRPWSAAWSAFGITLLAPQIERMFGHFSLSWSMAVPLAWLLLARAAGDRHRVRWLCALAVANSAWWFVHPYLGFMVTVLGACFALFLFVRKEGGLSGTRALVLTTAAAVVPVLLFKLVLLITDHHVGRTLHPSGFFDFMAEPDDVLFPHAPPLKEVYDGMWFGPIRQQWEAWCYIGLGTELVLLAWLWRSIRRRIAHRTGERLPPLLAAAVPGALLLLLLSFGIPFAFAPRLLAWMPVMEQFRALGRFTWPFYFVTTVLAAVLVDRWSKAWSIDGRTWMAFTFPVLLPLSWVVEGHDGQSHVDRLIAHPNVFSTEHALPGINGMVGSIDVQAYQALLPMPFFNLGSESFARPIRGSEVAEGAMSISLFTGLPILGCDLSRVPVPESKMLTQVVSPRYYTKALRDTLHDPRPLLVLRAPGELTPWERDLLRDAVPLDSAGGSTLYRLPLAALFRSTVEEAFARFQQRSTTLHARQGLLFSDSAALVFHRDMEDRPSAIAYRGHGALATTKNGDHVLGSFHLQGVRSGTPMVATLWMYNAVPEALNLGLWLDVADTNGHALASVRPDESEVIDGDWSMVEVPFTTAQDDERIELITHWTYWFERPMVVDEILLRPQACDVYRLDTLADGAEDLLYNGYWIRRPQRTTP